MQRRRFLLALAAGAASALTGCGVDPAPPTKGQALTGSIVADPTPAVVIGSQLQPATPDLQVPAFFPPVGLTRVRPDSIISDLPGQGSNMALTVDDGISTEVVAAYIEFARTSGARFTFFVNGFNDSWTLNAPALRPLVESGQIQLANHTWSHPDLTKISSGEIRQELSRNELFVQRIYGVTSRPFFRPPFGFHNARVRAVAAEEGYPVATLWLGSLGDAAVLTEEQILGQAREWFKQQSVVIGHANHPAVTHIYGQLVDIIQERNLHLVTLNDVFL
jgi:peptidoglycan/xylan/chitin deacetylase (PgdA/CDA1 family)